MLKFDWAWYELGNFFLTRATFLYNLFLAAVSRTDVYAFDWSMPETLLVIVSHLVKLHFTAF